jgi:hypothetical protein
MRKSQSSLVRSLIAVIYRSHERELTDDTARRY